MKIIKMQGRNDIYSSNVYFATGEWKTIKDVNTLIDVGADPSIIETLERTNTGVGKKKVDQVILTHSHSDHTALLTFIRKTYNPVVYAFNPHLEGVDRTLMDGDHIRVGNCFFEVIHTPGHSDDSICLYNSDEGILFAGDVPLVIRSSDGTYEDAFIEALERIAARKVRTIYFGHGNPLLDGASEVIRSSLRNCLKSRKSHCPDYSLNASLNFRMSCC